MYLREQDFKIYLFLLYLYNFRILLKYLYFLNKPYFLFLIHQNLLILFFHFILLHLSFHIGHLLSYYNHYNSYHKILSNIFLFHQVVLQNILPIQKIRNYLTHIDLLLYRKPYYYAVSNIYVLFFCLLYLRSDLYKIYYLFYL